jgi:precorrin-6x reductase
MILVLAGTSDARELALQIKEAGYDLLTKSIGSWQREADRGG